MCVCWMHNRTLYYIDETVPGELWPPSHSLHSLVGKFVLSQQSSCRTIYLSRSVFPEQELPEVEADVKTRKNRK